MDNCNNNEEIVTTGGDGIDYQQREDKVFNAFDMKAEKERSETVTTPTICTPATVTVTSHNRRRVVHLETGKTITWVSATVLTLKFRTTKITAAATSRERPIQYHG